jgi:3-oxoacyl-[acyl-carrier protein] reductase
MRVVLVTGVSRRAGIGFAIARRALADGASVMLHSFAPYDAERPWGADPGGVAALVEELGGPSDRLAQVEADLGDPEAPAAVVDATVEAFGAIDALVVNHARDSDQTLATVTAAELDRAWAVNARAAVLLTQAFAAAHGEDRQHGRVILFTSGQHLGPMPDELPYAISKGAVHQMTPSLADALADRGITVNAINPGPVDTGWPSDELRADLKRRFPTGRLGRPEDVAGVVAWLLSPQSAPVTGQVIDAEAGFRR